MIDSYLRNLAAEFFPRSSLAGYPFFRPKGENDSGTKQHFLVSLSDT